MSNRTILFDAHERVLVIGLGKSGRASVAVLQPRCASVIATDEKDPESLADTIAEIGALGVAFVPPAELGDALRNVTAAVLSPGIPLNGALVRRVQDAGIPVYSEVEVAYRIARAPIVAVTGTKGKTTTTALVGHIFATAGKQTFVGGNIGNPLIAETAIAPPDAWVIAEVSSFQLESIRAFKPRISLILNISPDHLDRYHSMDEYAYAKFRVFANQNAGDTFVGNLDDPRVGALARLEPDDDRVRIRARSLWFSNAPHRQSTLYIRNGTTIVYAPPTGDPRPVEIMHVDAIPLLGQHNVENAMGAILVGLAAGLDRTAIADAVRSFAPLAHRLQTVAESGGVTFVDDSKATNPGAVIAALQAFEQPVVLIAGGRGKGTAFEELGAAIGGRVKALVLIGEAADAIGAHVAGVTIARAASMAEAVQTARELASAGDVVLLSPGCASFDMFASAEARGDAFVAAVRGGALV
jgi:UDP-N-acetylmuramoylalanine--D-glutamate ligase